MEMGVVKSATGSPASAASVKVRSAGSLIANYFDQAQVGFATYGID